MYVLISLLLIRALDLESLDLVKEREGEGGRPLLLDIDQAWAVQR